MLDVAPHLSPINSERQSPAYCHLEDTPPPAKKRNPEVVRWYRECNPKKEEAEKGAEQEKETPDNSSQTDIDGPVCQHCSRSGLEYDSA